MPYPSQVNAEQIVEMASAMIEEQGVEALSLARLATALGVKAPSLYRYFNGRLALLQAVNNRTIHTMTARLHAEAVRISSPRARLVAYIHAYRAFALRYPALYQLLFINPVDDLRPDQALREAFVAPAEEAMTQLVSPEEVITAMRGLWALMHGYVMLELGAHMWAGGDYDTTFARIVDVYLDSWIA